MPEPSLPAALVVDDSSMGRTFLCSLLKRAGYATEVAGTGEEALARFVPGKFDVVFMDIMMPGIDGIETTRRIKGLCGAIFTPIIFVTGADDADSLVRAIDAGGDDFLTKPVTPEILLAKLRAMARIRELHERTRLLYARVVEDQEIAREVFDRAVGSRAFVSSQLRSMLIPAEVFSGDIMLAALSPKGRLHVLVGDFTGHGLAAALGAMPVAETFRATVALDLAAEAMLEMLNQKVADALPRGHFLAASLISIDRDLSRMVAANCGMPDLLLCGPHGVRERIASASFALGIVEDASFADAVRTVAIARGERLIMATDGITEAVNADGAAFGEARLEAVLAQEDEGGAGAPALATAALHQFRGQTPLADDVSIVEIRFNEALFGAAPAADPLAPETASPPRS